MNGELHKPFVLKGGKIRRRQGEKTEYHSPCFPGYVFVESSESPTEFIQTINPLIRGIEGIFKLLNNGDESNIAICEDERQILWELFGDDHRIDVPTVLKVGDSVEVVSGPLRGHESKIVKVDKNGVMINLDMFGKTTKVVLGVELVRVVESKMGGKIKDAEMQGCRMQ